MTSRERFLKVLNGEIPDRVPITFFVLDQGHFISQMYPEVDPQDFPTLQLKVIEIQKQLGADVFVRMLFDVNDPLHIHMGGLDVTQQNENWEIETSDSRPIHDDQDAEQGDAGAD
jgi:hypothetical protein